VDGLREEGGSGVFEQEPVGAGFNAPWIDDILVCVVWEFDISRRW
jgi:hypothetical protein